MTPLEAYLQEIAEKSESYFQAHLAREDAGRVARLAEMARAEAEVGALEKDALYIGWTPGDLRTSELKPVLIPLIRAMHAHVNAPQDDQNARELFDCWKAFHEERIKVLIHCL